MTFDNTPAQVVVIEDRKRKKGLAWLAGGAALALLLSGGTFALWRASAAFTGGQVTAGDLDLTGCENVTWYDISPDRWDARDIGSDADQKGIDLAAEFTSVDFASSPLLGTGNASHASTSINGLAQTYSEYASDTYPTALTSYVNGDHVYAHEIVDTETWRMVPGDTVLAICADAVVSLEGDNLVASLTLTDSEGNAIDFNEAGTSDEWDGVVIGSEVYVQGAIVPPGVGGSLGYFGAPGTEAAGQDNGILLEGNGVVELHAKSFTGGHVVNNDTDTGPFVDLRYPTFSGGTLTGFSEDGRPSLGQDYVSALFVIHFIDDGIEGVVAGTPATCTLDSDTQAWDDPESGHVAGNCLDEGKEFAAATADSFGYIPDTGSLDNAAGNGDASDIEHNRYLATQALARLSDGRLVLKQVRDSRGQFVETLTP